MRVELFERRLTPELESRLIERLTETLLETLEAPELREAHVGDRGGPRRPPVGPQRQALGRSGLKRRAAQTGGATTVSASSTGGAPRWTSAASRACRSVVRTISFARA